MYILGVAAGAAMMYIIAQVNEWALAYASQTLICSVWGCACVYLFYDGVVTAANLRNSEVRVRDLGARLDAKDLSITLIAKKLDDNYQLTLENRKRLLSIQRHNNNNTNSCSNSLNGGSGDAESLLFTKEYEKKRAESGSPKQKQHPPAPPSPPLPAAAHGGDYTAPGGVFSRSASDIISPITGGF